MPRVVPSVDGGANVDSDLAEAARMVCRVELRGQVRLGNGSRSATCRPGSLPSPDRGAPRAAAHLRPPTTRTACGGCATSSEGLASVHGLQQLEVFVTGCLEIRHELVQLGVVGGLIEIGLAGLSAVVQVRQDG